MKTTQSSRAIFFSIRDIDFYRINPTFTNGFIPNQLFLFLSMSGLRKTKASLKKIFLTFVTITLFIAITWKSEARRTTGLEIYSTLTSDTTPLSKKDSAALLSRDTIPADQDTVPVARDTTPAPRRDTLPARTNTSQRAGILGRARSAADTAA
ncbi:MAG TPA: hypothetical protein VHK69_17715, partial [Chitinophagaceae bacterium]|nr:hypothetical protein [Chitinophagaceae bacterium]